MRRNKLYIFIFMVALLSSCASKKTATETTATIDVVAPRVDKSATTAFLKKAASNAVTSRNITGNMNFSVEMGKKDISVPGSVHMRKDEVIRLQLFIPILGTEVGRLEFTPDYVLVVDRMHKEYIKADYNQLDFLRDNGLTFYSLQALFWNELLVPGKQHVDDGDYGKYSVDIKSGVSEYPVSIRNGSMSYRWNLNSADATINSALITYSSGSEGTSTLNWKYGDFKKVGQKRFPATQSFTFTTTALDKKQSATVTIKMSNVKTDDKWDAQTSISSKYKKIEATDLFTKLLQM